MAAPPQIGDLAGLGAHLRRLRRDRRLTQDNVVGRVAARGGQLRRERISEIENARRDPPSVDELEKILRALGRQQDNDTLQIARAHAVSARRATGGDPPKPGQPPTASPDWQASQEVPATHPVIAAHPTGFTWRHMWLATLTGVIATAALGAGGVLTGHITMDTARPVPTAPTLDQVLPPWPPLHRSGVVTLRDDQGVDLDVGAVFPDEDHPGVDLSPYSGASHLGAMDPNVSYTVLPVPVPSERGRCAEAVGWTRYYPDLYGLAAGRAVCVRTSEDRLTMLVIEKPATQSSGRIGFRYFTWESS